MKYVESYWVELLSSGVVHLLINCTQREIYFHAFNDNMILISGTKEEYDNWTNEVVLTTDSFLPKIEGIWIQTSMKEKDQLSFYYIPYYWGERKNKKTLIDLVKVKE